MFKKFFVILLAFFLSYSSSAPYVNGAKKIIKVKVKKSQILEKGLDALKAQLKEALLKAEKEKKAAEEAAKKLEEEKKKANEAAKIAEEAKKLAEEAAKKAEKEKKEAEKTKTDEEKKQAEEAKKKADDAKKKADEETKKAEDEKKKKEEQEKRTKEAKKQAEESKKRADQMKKQLEDRQKEFDSQKKREKEEAGKNPTGIAGTVKNDKDGSPIAGAVVKVKDTANQIVTSGDGSFNLNITIPQGVEKHTVFVNVSKEGYSVLEQEIAISIGEIHSKDFHLRSNIGILQGEVRKLGTGDPISGAIVKIKETANQTVTGGDGSYALNVTIPAGEKYTVSVIVNKEGYTELDQQVAVALGETSKKDFHLQGAEKAKGNISGKVFVKEEGGKKVPVAKAKVTYEGPSNGVVETDSGGHYLISGKLTQGDYTVYVSESEIGSSQMQTVSLKDQNMIVDFEVPDSEQEVEIEVGE